MDEAKSATSEAVSVNGATEATAAAAPTESDTKTQETKRTFTFPSAYTILFLLLIVVTILTWIIPAGRYEYAADGAPIPGTYHAVPQNPLRIVEGALLGPVDGMYGLKDSDGFVSANNSGSLYGAINVALFVLVIGGFLGLTMKTGAVDAGIGAAVRGLGTRGTWLIPILMVLFALGGTSYGMAEESLAFYMLVIAAIIALRFDAVTGVAVVMLGAGIGVLGSTVNPFATGIASGFAGIPLTEGIAYRLVILVLGVLLGIFFVMRYAKRVERDPSRSLVYPQKTENEQFFLARGGAQETPALTGQRKAILALFGLAFLVMIYSVIPWADLGITAVPTLGWWFPQLTALFLLFAIAIGVAGRMGEQELTAGFVDGARDLLGVALVVGLARGISVVMNNGLITDTVLDWAAHLVAGLPPVLFINAVWLIYLPLSFLIPSSSGLATVSMPVMAPLADFAGVPKHLVVTAYQSANGLVNLFTPTFAVVAGGLAIGRVKFDVWWRFVLPLLLLLALLCVVVLSIGAVIGQ
jgi:uncharacterized ion transporter superfamily protein YfcC